jgi:hypothetical protein
MMTPSCLLFFKYCYFLLCRFNFGLANNISWITSKFDTSNNASEGIAVPVMLEESFHFCYLTFNSFVCRCS